MGGTTRRQAGKCVRHKMRTLISYPISYLCTIQAITHRITLELDFQNKKDYLHFFSSLLRILPVPQFSFQYNAMSVSPIGAASYKMINDQHKKTANALPHSPAPPQTTRPLYPEFNNGNVKKYRQSSLSPSVPKFWPKLGSPLTISPLSRISHNNVNSRLTHGIRGTHFESLSLVGDGSKHL